MPELDLTFVEQTVSERGPRPEQVIPILQDIQRHYRFLPDEALQRLCEVSEITPSAVEGVSTFYAQFRRRPIGRHLIKVCNGTACHVKGAPAISDAFRTRLQIPDTDDTDPDGEYTIEDAFCLGCCTLAPVVQIDDVTYGHVTQDRVSKVLRDFAEHEKQPGSAAPANTSNGRSDGEIRICLDSCCVARGCGSTHEAIYQSILETGVRADIKRVACPVICEETPLVEIALPDRKPVLYPGVHESDVKEIVLGHFRPRGIINRFRSLMSGALDQLLTDEVWEPVARYSSDVRDPPVAAFFGPQKHIATEHYGHIDPLSLDDYIEHQGFDALGKCLDTLSPEEVVAIVAQSGLRGRGGAGFPTGKKWKMMQAAEGKRRFVICNGDEGDPGAFMDRMLMESFPYRVIEGLAIAAYAAGAHEGKLYIRAEYPFAVERVTEALRRCEEQGILGEKVLGRDFSLELEVFEGAGAFVCGEETAMLESIEGRRGIPRLRPPYPIEQGLWDCPTLINNVETLAVIPWILREGAEAFSSLGTESSRGTKVFALAGKVTRGGLIEVPMGITIQEIVDEIGGGVPDGGQLKAVLIGGPSGGCVPAELAQTPIDYDSLRQAGAIMGSGGLVVLDDTDCMVSIARYFLSFCQYESCGKCTYCRIGTRRMLDIMDRLCNGKGRKGDIEDLESLSGLVKSGSLCGLGKTAPNPIVTTLKFFREEYEAHLAGRCPAGKCEALITYSVRDSCIGCTLCAQHCPVDAIPLTPYQKHEIDTETCTHCDTCRQVCTEDAIHVE
ncbi:MAG: NAD(P)H-dependent oxidoreductase subunit E [Planctomycetota bacterium]|jgi:NADH-quinone oxidoreductase subunit F|nr:NAD(P)H-dependent oxidoreductase subunit E [Planctomycetota bacterium]